MKLIGIYRIQSGKRVKIAQEAVDLLGLNEGDKLVELLDEEKRVIVLMKREDYESERSS